MHDVFNNRMFPLIFLCSHAASWRLPYGWIPVWSGRLVHPHALAVRRRHGLHGPQRWEELWRCHSYVWPCRQVHLQGFRSVLEGWSRNFPLNQNSFFLQICVMEIYAKMCDKKLLAIQNQSMWLTFKLAVWNKFPFITSTQKRLINSGVFITCCANWFWQLN